MKTSLSATVRVSRGSARRADVIYGSMNPPAHVSGPSSAEERTDWGVMKEKIRTDLRRFLTKQTSRRPLIMPVILEI